MRCFIAAEIPEEAKYSLADIQTSLKVKVKAKWVEKENLHITLKFLGELDSRKVNLVQKVLEELKEKQFGFFIKGIGCFPQPDKAKVLFAQCNCLPLFGIYKYIHKKTLRINKTQEKRNFNPHITLARLKIPQNISLLLGKIPVPKAEYKIKRITLFESQLRKEGPVYFKIFTKNLAE